MLLTTSKFSLIILNVVLKLVLYSQKTQGGLNHNVHMNKFLILSFLSIVKKFRDLANNIFSCQ